MLNDSGMQRQSSNKNVEYRSREGKSPTIDRLTYSKHQFTVSSSKEDTFPSTERRRGMDPESMAKHLRMKQLKKEAKRDIQYKRMLMIFSRSQKRNKNLQSSGKKTSSKNEEILGSTQRQGLIMLTTGESKMKYIEDNPYEDQEATQNERSNSRESK